MCDTFSFVTICVATMWLSILTAVTVLQTYKVNKLLRFAESSTLTWNNTFALCAVCTKVMFTANAPKIMHTKEGTKYVCEACKDAQL